MATANKFKGYYKVAQPVSVTTAMTDSQNIGDQASFTNYTFYQRLIQGAASRIIRYREYDLADHDVEIARSLDTIAEEMTGNAVDSPCPLEIQYITPYGSEPTQPRESTTIAIEAALHYWCELMKLDRRMFGICRTTAKYGDCFFTVNKKGKWEFVHPKNVSAAIVDEHDMTEVRGWQIRKDIKVPTSPFNTGSQSVTTSMTGNTDALDSDIYSADDVIWFTLGDDTSESAPFGESVLRAVYKAQKQKELLEDSIIIYRLVRAPERRVFYIDVGKMPNHKVKGHLEQIRNEYRQRNTPSHGGQTDQVDAVYNPMSTSEDLFFATRPGGGGTRVDTLPAGQVTGVIEDLKYFQWKVYRGLRIPLSYMSEEDSAQITDGANSYVSELRFALYIMRMQRNLNTTFDFAFKQYLRANGIKFDPYKFKVKLPDPENFGIYRQQALDTELLNTASSASTIPGLSARFIMQRYMGLTEAEIKRNERLKLEELGINPDEPTPIDLALIYSADGGGNDNMMTAGSLDMGGGYAGGGMDMGMTSDITPDQPANAQQSQQPSGDLPPDQ